MRGELLVVLKAAIAAAAVSLPPGPAAALCGAHLRGRGLAAGAAAALGAAIADAFYGLLAARGVAPLSMLVPSVRRAFVVLLAVGFGVAALVALRRVGRPCTRQPSAHPCGQGLLLALAAPGVLPSYLVLHAALGLPGAAFPLVALGTVLGCAVAWALVLLVLDRCVAAAPRLFEYVLPAALLIGGFGLLGSALR